MRPPLSSKPPPAGARATGDTDGGSKGPGSATVSSDAPAKNRRGGRRGQRRAGLQDTAAGLTTTPPTTATAEAATRRKDVVTPTPRATTTTTQRHTETVVVPVRGETTTGTGEKRPVNSTSVRRRDKSNSTVTKVVTGVSLEALRAKRNGTTAETTPDGDAKTVEEVSRILFMYASQQQQQQHQQHHQQQQQQQQHQHQHGGKNSKRPGPIQNTPNWLAVAREGGGDRMGAVKAELLVDERQQHLEGMLKSTRDVQAHVISLIHSGKLPPDSLKVLQAMLCHTSQGGKLDMFELPTKGKHSGTQQGFTSAMRVDCQPQPQPQPPCERDLYCYSEQIQRQQQQQQPMMGFTEEEYFGCGGYTQRSEQTYYQGLGGSPPDVIPVPNAPANEITTSGCEGTSGGGSRNSSRSPFPVLGGYTVQQHMYTCGVTAGYAGGYEGYTHAAEAVPGERDAAVYTRDDDEDAEVTEMLQGIREALQKASSPRQLRCASASTVAAGAVGGGGGGDYSDIAQDGACLLPSSPAPCVTITQAERETLRSIQQAFLARMRLTGSPEWKSPGATPPKSLMCTFAEDEEFCGSYAAMQQQQQKEQEQLQEDDSRFTTNRTLFSYRTAFLEDDAGMTLDGCGMRDASVATTAAAQQQQQQPQQQMQWLDESSAVPPSARLSQLFSVIRGERTAEDTLWSWAAENDRGERRVADTTTARTMTTTTPCRWNYDCSDSAEQYTRFSSITAFTPQQPTTQKKQLLQESRLPCSPATCDLASLTHPATATTTPPEMAKTCATILNSNAEPFLPSRTGESTADFA
ncbi:hypothetical protein DQ04_03781000 [Trypanosoma grayi]|uniref:hypothetical protein n=1 Tax=Trypanosoma grayi TaxID=71804 RepID=UPI0004F43DB1|nr:hypothetical protein DQ04_03781000 [Trypanosoma grayi]KEG10380.1 hypothetical protein DQ04_03781000 [Trypanosoma grayi]